MMATEPQGRTASFLTPIVSSAAPSSRRRFVRFLSSKGYRQVYAPPKGRGKWRFNYPDIVGRSSALLIDFNYSERVPLFGANTLSSVPFGKYDVPVLNVHEVVAAKLNALDSRTKSRDLFDTDLILDMTDLDWRKIKDSILVLGVWQYRGDWREASSDLIIVDTTRRGFGSNAHKTLDRLSKDWSRIGPVDVEACR